MYRVLRTPGDGFEPPLKEPESFVLPLDDPGLILHNTNISKFIYKWFNPNMFIVLSICKKGENIC